MKSNYYIRRVNSPFDDSGIFVRNVYMKKAVLFDCGRLGNIDNSELNDISYIFISHTHVDHFSGFDRFLRTSLLSGNTFTFFGPKGFINNVYGKLSSYTWNLIYDYDIVFRAIELRLDGIIGAEFSSKNGFVKEDYNVNNAVSLDDGFTIEYDFFDHGIPSIGYRLKEPKRISMNKEKMSKYGLKQGVWIKTLKDIILSNNGNDLLEVDTINGKKNYYTDELKNMVVEYPIPQDITYITDIAPTFNNYKKAISLARDSFVLLIESVFMNNDILHAMEKNHLSIGLSKQIFKESNSKLVSFGHFAPKYDKVRDIFFNELYKDLDMKKIVKNELNR